MNKTYYYIAYGSNLNKEQMKFRCPDAKPIGTAVLPKHSLYFRGSQSGNYLTVEKEAGGFVPVAIWAVSAADMKSLDRYEGYPTFYRKESIPIIIEGKRVEAVIYIMNEGRPYGPPTKYYLETCLEGYRDFGFDSEVLYEAVRKSKGAKQYGKY